MSAFLVLLIFEPLYLTDPIIDELGSTDLISQSWTRLVRLWQSTNESLPDHISLLARRQERVQL